MDLLENLAALAALIDGRVGLFVDFDGTISHLAPTPEAAVVSPKAACALRRLAGRLALACVISGRGVADLRERVGVEGLVYVGNHGAERFEDGRLAAAPGMAEYRRSIGALLIALRRRVDHAGIVWENKGYSAAVHFRAVEDPSSTRMALAAAVSAAEEAEGLQVFWGKMIIEVRPPNEIHKGVALRELVHERRLDSAIVVGDDMTDLDAMKALRDMRDRDGLRGVGVAVVDASTPKELVRSADYTLDGVRAVETLLAWLWRVISCDLTTGSVETAE